MNVLTNRMGGAAMAAFLMLAGCGGGSNAPTAETVEISGGAEAQEGIAQEGVIASDESTTIDVTVNGATVEAVVPANVDVAVGQELAILPQNTAFIGGLTEVPQNRGPGDIWVRGRRTGVRLVEGRLSRALAFPAGQYDLRAEGPLRVGQGATSLTMANVRFFFSSNGRQLSLPTSITGRIPANGSSNWQNSVTVTFGVPYRTGTASLSIDHRNGTLSKSDPVDANGTATFADLYQDSASMIPDRGVDRIDFTHY
jgi:hypothetical protein